MNPQNNIFLITHEYPPFKGGIATYCHEFASALRRQGFPITVWAPSYSQKHGSVDDPPWLERLPFPGGVKFSSYLFLGFALALRRSRLRGSSVLLPSIGPQIMFMRMMPSGIIPPARVMVLWHGSEIGRFAKNRKLQRESLAFFSRCEHLFTASQYTRELVASSFMQPLHPRIKVLPCAPSSHSSKVCTPVRPPREGKLDLLTLARLHPRKGHADVIEAIGLLPKTSRDRILYRIGGSGSSEYLESLQKLASTLDVRLHYLGVVPEEKISETYAACDLFVMTSIKLKDSVEGFGISYLEAGLQSKPSLAYDTGGVKEAVIHGFTGILIQEGDIQSLSQSILDLLENPGKLLQLGNAARAHALRFRWEDTAKKFIDFVSPLPS